MGGNRTDLVIVTVNDLPRVTGSPSVVFTVGDPEATVQFNITDLIHADMTFELSVDGTLVQSGPYGSEFIFTHSVDSSVVGEYAVILWVEDGLGLFAEFTSTIQITEVDPNDGNEDGSDDERKVASYTFLFPIFLIGVTQIFNKHRNIAHDR